MLTETLRGYFGKSVVLLASPAHRWNSATFLSDNPKDDERLLRSKLGLEMYSGIGSAAPVAWPDGLYQRTYFHRYEGALKPAKIKDDFKDGVLTLKTNGEEAFAEEDLKRIGMSKPVRFHRCLRGARLRVDAENVREDDFIRSVASAIGGKIVEKPNELYIDVDAAIYVRRALAYWAIVKNRAERKGDFVEAADAEYMTLVLTKAPTSFVKKALDNPHILHGLPAPPGTPLFAAAWKRVSLRFAQRISGRNATEKMFQTIVDRDQPVDALIDGQGNATTAFYNRDRSRIIQY